MSNKTFTSSSHSSTSSSVNISFIFKESFIILHLQIRTHRVAYPYLYDHSVNTVCSNVLWILRRELLKVIPVVNSYCVYHTIAGYLYILYEDSSHRVTISLMFPCREVELCSHFGVIPEAHLLVVSRRLKMFSRLDKPCRIFLFSLTLYQL